MAKQNYVFYEKTNPFPGWIRMVGHVDLDRPPDGSTLAERLEQLKIKYPDADYKLFSFGALPDPKIVKFDIVTEALIDLGSGDVDRDAIKVKLNQEVNAYICAHYDLGTQASMQAIYIMPTTPIAAKDLLLTVWSWVQSVLTYYYSKKAGLTVAEDPAIITWSFSQFDTTDPEVSLQSLIAG